MEKERCFHGLDAGVINKIRKRKSTAWRVCSRDCNEADPMNANQKLGWARSGKQTIEAGAETQEEVLEGKMDHYCKKAMGVRSCSQPCVFRPCASDVLSCI